MAKTVKPEMVKEAPPAVAPQHKTDQTLAQQKNKVDLAKEYLNKYHLGWDAYLKSENN